MSAPVIFWWQTPDRCTWRTAVGVLMLTVSKTSTGQWAGTVEGPGISKRSPEFRTRLAAQGWAKSSAGGGR